jgi:hypothetical protein
MDLMQLWCHCCEVRCDIIFHVHVMLIFLRAATQSYESIFMTSKDRTVHHVPFWVLTSGVCIPSSMIQPLFEASCLNFILCNTIKYNLQIFLYDFFELQFHLWKQE